MPTVLISILSIVKFSMKYNYGYNLETVNYVESATYMFILAKYLTLQCKHKRPSISETKLIVLMFIIVAAMSG